MTDSRYNSANWINKYSEDGAFLLIPPKTYRTERNIATMISPYGYLINSYVDLIPSYEYNGYIPFVGEYYDRFLNNTNVNIIYSTSDISIGHARAMNINFYR